MNKRKLLSLAMALCIIAIVAVGGTLAYFQDSDKAINTFTVGNVSIVQYEKQREVDSEGNFTGKFVDYPNGTNDDAIDLFPIIDDSAKDENGYRTGENYVDKIVTVKNTGSRPAYVRTFLAIPAVLDDGPTDFDAGANRLHWNGASASDTNKAANPDGSVNNDWYYGKTFAEGTDWPNNGGDWNGYVAEIGSVKYNVYVATHKSEVKSQETTAPTLLGVYLDKNINYNGTQYVDQKNQTFDMPKDSEGNVKFDVLVASEAVQTEGFVDENNNNSAADDALNKAFGAIGSYCPFGGTIEAVFSNVATNP